MSDDLRDMMPTSEEFYAEQAPAEQAPAGQPKGVCEDAPCCGCCGGSIEDGYGSPADDAWHDANEYPEW
jgi:hypothetical protein